MPRLKNRNLIIIEQNLPQLHLDSTTRLLITLALAFRAKTLLILALTLMRIRIRIRILFAFIVFIRRVSSAIIICIIIPLRLLVLGLWIE